MTVTTPRTRRSDPAVGHVLRVERLTPGLVRVVVGGLAGFAPSPFADSYVKLMFAPAGPRPLLEDGRVDGAALRESLGEGQAPRLRAYTVRAYDETARELTLDVVVHGDEGLAGPWAAAARGGEEVLVLGPGGAWSPSDEVDAHVLLGDASALPAIAVALERLPATARGVAVIEVHDAADELPLAAPAGVDVRWVHTGTGVPGAALVAGALALEWPAGRVGAFLHGEAGAVRELRRHLRADRGVAREDLSVSGYWRLGVDDEGWRAAKREWAEQIEQQEATTLP